MPSPLLGTSQVEPDTLEGIWIFSETHYCGFFVDKKRKPFQGDQPTEAEEALAFRSRRSGAGTYSISGSTLINNGEYDRVPDSGSHRWEFIRNGDTVSMHSVRPDGTKGLELNLVKLD